MYAACLAFANLTWSKVRLLYVIEAVALVIAYPRVAFSAFGAFDLRWDLSGFRHRHRRGPFCAVVTWLDVPAFGPHFLDFLPRRSRYSVIQT